MTSSTIPTSVLSHPDVVTIHSLSSTGEIVATFHLITTPQGTGVLYPDATKLHGVWCYNLIG